MNIVDRIMLAVGLIVECFLAYGFLASPNIQNRTLYFILGALGGFYAICARLGYKQSKMFNDR